ncbi:hypothetical protein K3495_g11214 [Podosphaera aphanis]|nr:hypothetical protein K3495_g11214 [Podosphaera aphanis]
MINLPNVFPPVFCTSNLTQKSNPTDLYHFFGNRVSRTSSINSLTNSVFRGTFAYALRAYSYTYTISETHISSADLSIASLRQSTSYGAPSPFNASKVAMIIESRPIPHLLPLVLHMMLTLPPDFRFKFIGSKQSALVVGRSFATQQHIVDGKLDLMVLPMPWEIDSNEHIYRLLTDMRFYNEFLSEVEWLVKFESDSIMCAQSRDSLDEWLEYSWAGAVRNKDRPLVYGGLTLRRVSMVKRVLALHARLNDTEPEDEWLGKHIPLISDSKIATELRGVHFSSVEPKYNNSMGYHLRDGNPNFADNWQIAETRKATLKYCPELAIIMPMKLESDRCDTSSYDG